MTSQKTSPFQKLAPKKRLYLTLATVLLITALPSYHLWQAVLFAAFLLSLCLLARLPLSFFGQRLRLTLPFLLLLLLFLPFASRGGTLIVIPIGTFHIPLYSKGTSLAAFIMLKALMALTAMSVLAYSTSFQEIIDALEQIHLPKIMLLLIGFLYRYLPTLKADALALRRSQKLRTFGRTGKAPIATLGNLIGTLFLRSYERSERIYLAMRARGFQRHKPLSPTNSTLSREQLLLLLVTSFSSIASRLI